MACPNIRSWRFVLPLLLSLAGCRGPLAALPGNPLVSDTRADRVRYGQTPAEKVEELRELAKNADGLPAGEREEIAKSLVLQLGQEENPHLRMELARTLGFLPAQASLSGLLISLSDPQVEVRLAACEALGRLGNPSAIPVLSEALSEDDDVDVRLAAARALGNFQHPQALVALADTLEDRDPAIRIRGMDSLRRVSDVDLQYDALAWQNHISGVVASLERDRQDLARRPPLNGAGPSGAPPPGSAWPPGNTTPGTAPWEVRPAGLAR